MASSSRQGSATITMGVEGADASRREIETVGDALRRINAASLDRLTGQVSAMEGRFSSLQSTIGNVAGFSIAGLSIGALVTKVQDAIGVMGDLDDMAQKTGSSVESLSRLQKVANAFGVDMGTVDSALTKLAKGMAGVDEKGSKTGKAMAAIGVSARDADGKLRSSSDVMVDIAHKLQDYEDGASKAALMNDLFGKSGADLLPFMNDLSENVDKFSAVSKESTKRAAALQDQFGFLRVRTDELYMSVAEATLPAMTDLAGAMLDVANEQKGMTSGKGVEWADELAVGLARVVDVALLVPRVLSTLWGSVKAVGADVGALQVAAENSNPLKVAFKYFKGGDPLAEIRKAFDERNKVVEESNRKLDDLWNKPANLIEQATLKRIAGRGTTALAAAAGLNSISPKDKEKKNLNYSGGDGTDKAASDAMRKDAALLAELSGVTADYMENLEQLQKLRASGNLGEERYVELVTELISKQPSAKKWMDEQAKALEESNKRAAEGGRAWDAMMKAHQATVARTIEDATQEALKNEDLARTFGLTKSAVEQLELARLEEQLAQRSANALTLDEIETLEKLIAAKKRNVGAIAAIDAGESAKKAAQDLNAFLDPTRAQSFGEALRESFGSAGTAISKLTGSLDGFAKRQAAFAEQRANAEKARGTPELNELAYLRAVSELNERETKNRLAGYGDMASAAAGFFGEQSKGYQVLMTVSKVFHAAELAMTLAELVPKGISAVLSQGSGDPYTAFGRMAAMAAIVAGLGVAIGGVSGGGKPTSQQRQETQGTGSVLGNPTAKSESISRSLNMIEDASFQGLSISTDMLSALRNIESNIGNFAEFVVKTTALGEPIATGSRGSAEEFGRSNLGLSLAVMPIIGPLMDKLTGGWLGKVTGSMLNKLFGGKTTLEDTGFAMDKIAIGDVFRGQLKAMQYADIKKEGGLFRSDKYSTASEALSADGTRQFSQILTSLYGSVFEAGKMLGLGADDFSTELNGFVVDIDKISFKDMDDAKIQKELEAVFSKVGDDLAKFGVGGLEQFQKVGEGYLETLTRVATSYQTVAVVTQSLGMTFSALGLESVGARERLVELAGGLEEFTSSAENFLADFYTDKEQADALRSRIKPALDQYGIAAGAEDSLKQFRNVVTGLDLTTAAGAQAYATLMQIAPAFKQIADIDASIFEERSDLQRQYDELTMSSAQLLTQQRDALHESNRALFDQVQAVKDAAAAQQTAAQAVTARGANLLSGVDSAFSALQTVVGREKALLQEVTTKHQALASALRGTLDSMSVAGQEPQERQTAQAQIRAALLIARASGTLPEADSLKGALSIVARDASAMFATQEDYLRDFYSTQNDIAGLAGLTDKTLSVEEQSLKALDDVVKNAEQQINVLKGIDLSVLTVADAVSALARGLGAAQADPIASSGGSIANLYQSLLRRAPDSAGLAYWQEQVAGGMSIDRIRELIKGSSEFTSSGRVPEFASGGDFAGGVRIVGERGPEMEFTGASRIVSHEMLMSRLSSPSDGNAAMLHRLIEEVKSLRTAVFPLLYQTAKNTGRGASSLEHMDRVGVAIREEGVV